MSASDDDAQKRVRRAEDVAYLAERLVCSPVGLTLAGSLGEGRWPAELDCIYRLAEELVRRREALVTEAAK